MSVDFFSATGIFDQSIGDIFFVKECLSTSSKFETLIIFNPLINFFGISFKSFLFSFGIKTVFIFEAEECWEIEGYYDNRIITACECTILQLGTN